MDLIDSSSTQRFQAKKEAILDSAALVFNRRGIRGGTLADVAAGVGLVTTSVTYYYRKREDLAEACLLRTIAVLSDIVAQAAQHPTVEGRVRRLLSGYLRVIADIEDGRHWPMMYLNDMKALTPPHADRVLQAYKDVAKKVRGLIAGPETAHLGKQELNARGYLLLSLTQWARLSAASYDTSDYEMVARRTADILLNGLAMPGVPWPVERDAPAFWAAYRELPQLADPFLQVASKLINEHGYRGASIDQIAAQLNLTKGAFYGRRDNKSDLVAECFDRSFLVQRLAWDQADAVGDTGWSRLCLGLSSLLWFQVSPQGPMLRWIATTSLPDEAFRARVRATMRQANQRIEGLLVDGMSDGSIRPCAQFIAAQMLGCLIDTSAGLPRWEAAATGDTMASLYLRPMLFGLLS
jgi:AcrR family transcriptional regulator